MNLEHRQKHFQDPGVLYRAKPFWAWNGALEEQELLRQIDVFRQMGFGGFFMHSRTGLDTEYLGKEWFALIDRCAKYGAQQGMEAWLYDEDRWPSGSAGGLATRDPRFRAMYLEVRLLDDRQMVDFTPENEEDTVFALCMQDGIFTHKRRLQGGQTLRQGECAAVFHVRTSLCNDNYNGYCYLNTMNLQATEKYIELTHGAYEKKCGELFGDTIKGVFTDEPHRGAAFSDFAEGAVNAVPYTQDLFEQFQQRFGYNLREYLPELFFRRQEGDLSYVKRDYFELCEQLFLERFIRPISEWCQERKLILTGHMLHEDALCCQTVMQGSLMRAYEYMEYPGVDVLTESNTCWWIAKQVESVAHQMSKEWILSELNGCTGWQTSFQSYKNIGDWQALFGVNLRCPHLAYYTMKGEAKRDYPASIMSQSGWYDRYHYVEDYFARIHAAFYGAQRNCDLLVLYPIESIWARAYSGAFNGLFANDEQMKQIETQFRQTFIFLASSQIDFDYGEEDILARHGAVHGNMLYVGKAHYKTVLIAGMDTLRSTTLKLLCNFVRSGGKVVTAGRLPQYVDAKPAVQTLEYFLDKCTCVEFTREAIACACASGEELKLSGTNADSVFVRDTKVNGGRMVMLLNMDREAETGNLTIDFGPVADIERWDPRTGNIQHAEYKKQQGHLYITQSLEPGGERLYFLPDIPRTIRMKRQKTPSGWEKMMPIEAFSYRLAEPNVCVLDKVILRDVDGTIYPMMEVLRADRMFRRQHGLKLRGGSMMQPWYQRKYMPERIFPIGRIELEYSVWVETVPSGVLLACEGLENVESITVNEQTITPKVVKKWIDHCFDCLSIPDGTLKLGENRIRVIMSYAPLGGIEALYLLGNFGVSVKGEHVCIGTLPEKLRVGDIVGQGLPFYSGGIIYQLPKKIFRAKVRLGSFGGAAVILRGREEVCLAFSPYTAEVRDLCEIEVLLGRRNTFGPLHQLPERVNFYGPDNFVTDGEAWSDGYVLLKQGLLEPVQVEQVSQEENT